MSCQTTIVQLILGIKHQEDQIKSTIKKINYLCIHWCVTNATLASSSLIQPKFSLFQIFFPVEIRSNSSHLKKPKTVLNLFILYTLTKLYLESKVCGSWMFSTVVIFGSHWDLTGLAAARIDVLAFNWQIMPALAIDNVCCSLEKQNYINQWFLAVLWFQKSGVGSRLKLRNVLEINVQQGQCYF